MSKKEQEVLAICQRINITLMWYIFFIHDEGGYVYFFSIYLPYSG